jgi:ribosomal protein S18 acetylase RimI-like enzyme
VIRRAITEDIFKINEMLSREIGAFDEKEIEKNLKNNIFCVVYENNGEIVGFACINKGIRNLKKSTMILYVSEKYRGMGIGSSLYFRSLEYCNKENFECVSIDIRTEKNDTGKFFIGRGFEKWFSFSEMDYTKGKVESDLQVVNYDNKYYEYYKNAFEDAFFEMRQALGFMPVRDCYKPEELIENKDNIFLLIDSEEIIGAVILSANEIDEFFIAEKYQGKGYARKLLNFAIKYYQEKEVKKIFLGVADWNKRAVKLYESSGFTTTKKTCVYRKNLNI